MATLKKGTAIGITDSAYNSIRVGDTLKNIHSGLLATVNKYGQFVCSITGDKLDRDGSNWIVADTESEAPLDPAEQEEKEVMEQLPEIPQAPETLQPAEEKEAPSEEHAVLDTVIDFAVLFAGIDTAVLLAELKRRVEALSYFTEDEIFAELRSRGFSGTLDQEIIITKKHTI